ncbi:hypothetical protein VIF_003310 [Vibrio cholerae TM 11079-80]|nr:hypothetical protein VIF_003310 [Vibrio cholerae TM 11079-80]
MASSCNENTLGGASAICIVMFDAKAKELHHKVKISIHLIICYSALFDCVLLFNLKLQRY